MKPHERMTKQELLSVIERMGHERIRMEMDIEALEDELSMREWQLEKLVKRITTNWRKLRSERLEA